jgi:hypothetical protein
MELRFQRASDPSGDSSWMRAVLEAQLSPKARDTLYSMLSRSSWASDSLNRSSPATSFWNSYAEMWSSLSDDVEKRTIMAETKNDVRKIKKRDTNDDVRNER